ncbi:MAG: hypothetical protein CMC15_13955 [Flavobacteriaceae bacterium]|nr:hypothetical protein [Flavobacteriaceae bacterium]
MNPIPRIGNTRNETKGEQPMNTNAYTTKAARLYDAMNKNQPVMNYDQFIPPLTFVAIDVGQMLSHNYNLARLQKADKTVNSFGWCN